MENGTRQSPQRVEGKILTKETQELLRSIASDLHADTEECDIEELLKNARNKSRGSRNNKANSKKAGS